MVRYHLAQKVLTAQFGVYVPALPLQANLQELRVYDTLEALHHLLAPHAVAVTPAGARSHHGSTCPL
jgi:hypothetical protein